MFKNKRKLSDYKFSDSQYQKKFKIGINTAKAIEKDRETLKTERQQLQRNIERLQNDQSLKDRERRLEELERELPKKRKKQKIITAVFTAVSVIAIAAAFIYDGDSRNADREMQKAMSDYKNGINAKMSAYDKSIENKKNKYKEQVEKAKEAYRQELEEKVKLYQQVIEEYD